MNEDVRKYFSSVPEARIEKVEALHDLITRLYPKATVDMSCKMPTYRLGEGWVAIANQKNYVSLHTCGYHHIEYFRSQHPSIKTGKGCINFKDRDELPLQDIEAVVKHAIDHPKGN